MWRSSERLSGCLLEEIRKVPYRRSGNRRYKHYPRYLKIYIYLKTLCKIYEIMLNGRFRNNLLEDLDFLEDLRISYEAFQP